MQNMYLQSTDKVGISTSWQLKPKKGRGTFLNEWSTNWHIIKKNSHQCVDETPNIVCSYQSGLARHKNMRHFTTKSVQILKNTVKNTTRKNKAKGHTQQISTSNQMYMFAL